MCDIMQVDELTRLRLIFTWNLSVDDDDIGTDTRRAIKLAKKLMTDNWKHFTHGDWWLIYDSLGKYPHKNPTEHLLYKLATEKYNGSTFHPAKKE